MAIEYNKALQSWLALPGAHVNDEVGIAAFNNYWSQINDLPEGAFDAMQKLLQAKPDQAIAFTRQAGGNVAQWFQSMIDWWTENGEKAAPMISGYGPELELLDTLGYEVDPAAASAANAGQGVGLLDPNNPSAQQFETVMGGNLINDYIGPALARDKVNSARIDTLTADADRSIDRAITANRAVTGTSFDAAGYLRANPDVAALAADAVAKGLAPDIATAAKLHYDTYGQAEGRTGNQITRLQQENIQADETGRRIAEAAGQAATAKLAALDQRKIEMESALNRMQGDRSGALDAQTAQLREGLGVLETERRAALEELTRARVAAAETQVTGINQGLQAERDRITAKTAQQGFIGGSTMEDSALARATIGARQGAAEAMGGAKVANAMDVRGVGDEIAKTRFGITGNDATQRFGISEDTNRGRFNLADTLSSSRVGVRGTAAEQEQAARDLVTKARQGYFDADPLRSLNAAVTEAGLSTNRIGLVGAGEDARWGGYERAMKNLGWFSAQPPPPSTQPINYQASQTGNGIAQVGAGVANIGTSLLMNNWGRTAAGTTTTKPRINPEAPADDFDRKRWTGP